MSQALASRPVGKRAVSVPSTGRAIHRVRRGLRGSSADAIDDHIVKHGEAADPRERRRPPIRRTAAAIPRAQPEGSASGQTIAAGGVRTPPARGNGPNP